MIRKLFTITIILAGITLSSCEKVFGPDADNHSTEERLLRDPGFAEGLLLNAYVGLGTAYSLDETATDDAVTNVKGNNFARMATGEWSAQFDPMNKWGASYNQIFYLNYFLSIVKDVEWAWDDRTSPAADRNAHFVKRLTGEALGLRAWYSFELLKRHGGIGEDGTPKGFIILKDQITETTDRNLPRNSYEECVQFILSDLDQALTLLPEVYGNVGTDQAYNAVFGPQNKNRVCGIILKAIKARLLLHYASQSFNTDAAKWEKAADAAAAVLKFKGGLPGLSATGITFWRQINDGEILWRRDYQNINTREAANFPPSLFGSGQTNPSQNLVDAFPMANGLPILAAGSGYNVNAPYTGRDPRLKAYILYNGNDFNGRVVNTNVEDAKNGLNRTETSTRTGYYLKKLLQPAVSLDPRAPGTAQHIYTMLRYTEFFLAYAEAANEAWGPTADPKGNGFTPQTIIGAIRRRGGITQPDAYLVTAAATKELMRDLVRNERRIELCFEGSRFYDMRRWGLNLQEPVKGMQISGGIHTVINVEDRLYKPFMVYGPVPYQETIRSSNIIQNQGW